MNCFIRFKKKWLDQLADSKEMEDRHVAEAKAFITELYATDAVTPQQASTLLNHIGWLSAHINSRRLPAWQRWSNACKWWCVYFGMEVRGTIGWYWQELLYRLRPKNRAKTQEEIIEELTDKINFERR
jgi:hypothetical protein